MTFSILICATVFYLFTFILMGFEDGWLLPVHQYLWIALTVEFFIGVVISAVILFFKGLTLIFS